jgi:hypothetical protein
LKRHYSPHLRRKQNEIKSLSIQSISTHPPHSGSSRNPIKITLTYIRNHINGKKKPMTIFGTVTAKEQIKNGWEFELNIKLNFFIISTLGSQSDGNCTHFLCSLAGWCDGVDGKVSFIQKTSLSLTTSRESSRRATFPFVFHDVFCLPSRSSHYTSRR